MHDRAEYIDSIPQPIAQTPPARAVIFPLNGPTTGLDVTDALINVIADAIGRTAGGNRMLDHLEAELHLRALMGRISRN